MCARCQETKRSCPPTLCPQFSAPGSAAGGWQEEAGSALLRFAVCSLESLMLQSLLFFSLPGKATRHLPSGTGRYPGTRHMVTRAGAMSGATGRVGFRNEACLCGARSPEALGRAHCGRRALTEAEPSEAEVTVRNLRNGGAWPRPSLASSATRGKAGRRMGGRLTAPGWRLPGYCPPAPLDSPRFP